MEIMLINKIFLAVLFTGLLGLLYVYKPTTIVDDQTQRFYHFNVSKIKLLTQYVEEYKSVFGNYPSNEDGLAALYQLDNFKLSSPRAILDTWEHQMRYKQLNDDSPGFLIWTLGKDGEVGGESENMDIYSNEIEDHLTILENTTKLKGI